MLSALLLAPLSLSTRGARHAPPRSCAAAAGAPDEAQLALFASLRARSLEIEREVAERWREAAPVSSVPVALNDWIRRVALDWPLAACGTARGGLVLADLSSGDMLACAQDAHPSVVDTPEVRSAMRELHGEYDGNGVLSVALCGSRVASAGREGGVRLWRLDGDELVPTAELKVGALASSLLLPAGEEGPLWASFLDGSLCRWSSLGGEEPSLVVSCSAAALAAACCAPLELVAAATSAGEVELFSTRDGSPRGCWAPPEVGSARSVAFVRGEEEGWSVVVGGADGSIHRRWLREAQAAGGEAAGGAASVAAGFDEAREEEQLLPSHGGAVVGLAAAAAGLLVSGARDGTLRVWDLRRGAEERCLYGLGGYKVWLGSVCSDGARLVSDGRDNTLVLHDFSADARPDGDEIRRVGGREE